METLRFRRSFEDLTLNIFKAALDPQYWRDVVSGLSAVCNNNPFSLLACEPGSPEAPILFNHSIDDDFVQSYTENYHKVNCWAEQYSSWGSGRVFTASECVPRSELARTEFYNDWLRPQENLAGGVGLVLSSEGDLSFCLGATIRARQLEKDEDTAVRWLKQLAPYINQARAISQKLDGLRMDGFVAGQRLSEAGAGLFVINERRTLMQANKSGLAMLEEGTAPLWLRSGNRVELDETQPEDRLGLAISSRRRGLGVLATPFTLGRGKTRFTARALPLDAEAATELAPNWFGHKPMPSVLLIVDKDARPASPLQRLTQQFGLTPTEAEIVTRLSDGQTLEEIAEVRLTSIHTVRNQLKSALSKTGLRRQVELVSLVERLRRA